MPISKQQKEWLERFCKKNRFMFDEENSKQGFIAYKKYIGNNMLASIAYGEVSFMARFFLVVNKQSFKGLSQLPWLLIGENVSDLKLQLLASMHTAYEQVFDKVTGCGLDELRKVE